MFGLIYIYIVPNEELYSLYRSPNIVRVIKSRRLRWAGHVTRLEGGSAFKLLTGKPTGKRPLVRPRRRFDLQEIGINAGNWVDSAQDRDYWRALVNAALDLRVPKAMELVSYICCSFYIFFLWFLLIHSNLSHYPFSLSKTCFVYST